MNDPEITALVARLSRPHPSGGTVIERAAILASGGAYPEIMNWILAHSGTPEATTSARRNRGLHGSHLKETNRPQDQRPTRFVLPAGALRTPR